MDNLIEYWKDKGLRTSSFLITDAMDDKSVYANGCFEVQIFNQGDSDAFLSINGGEKLHIIKNKDGIITPIIFKGEPYIKNFNDYQFTFTDNKGELIVYLTFVVPIKKDVREAAYSYEQGEEK